MRKAGKRLLVIGLVTAGLVAVPWAVWCSLNHEPSFYRAAAQVPPERRHADARRFVAQSLQLRNDIDNEPIWEASFSDEQVNAWLAEDLVAQFADRIPTQVHDPRLAFDPDRVTLAFRLDRGPIRSVIWIVARCRVIEDNVLALTVEKVRAGVVPISAEPYLERLTREARDYGLDIRWGDDDGRPMALIRYRADPERTDVVLERILISRGEIRLAGRSRRDRGEIAAPVLPTGRLLQMTFPRRRYQVREISGLRPPEGTRPSSSSPAS